MDDTQSITIKKMPIKLWRTLKKSAIDKGQGISEFIVQILQQSANGKAK
jgi:hypothetical protein